MFGAVSLFFWGVLLCLCGFDSLDKNREKNRLRKEAERKGFAYYWANGKMYHTLTNKRCYGVADDNGDEILYEVGSGVRLCNASEFTRKRENIIYEKRKKLNETLDKFNQLPEEEKEKIRGTITQVKKTKEQKELESKYKGSKSIFQATVGVIVLGGIMNFSILLQCKFDSFVAIFIIMYIAISILLCARPYSRMKKTRKEYEEVL